MKNQAETKSNTLGKPHRSTALDSWRGFIVALMALDHTRDFFCATGFNPSDPDKTPVFLFLTRWITHLCAPAFFFLAGTGAGLSLSAGYSLKELKYFLRSRGVWMLFLGLTIVGFGWWYSLRWPAFEIFCGLGLAMIGLSILVRFPPAWVGIFGIGVIFGHNLLDGIKAEQFGSFHWIWQLLHEPGPMVYGLKYRTETMVLYGLLPWAGIMAAGYGFASLWQARPSRRAQDSATLGLVLIAAFLVLRYLNGYGDPNPWHEGSSDLRTVLSFLNVRKYPGSLDFVLVTLGLGFLILSIFEKVPGLQFKFLVVFGRVPLFFYLLHLYLIHSVAIVLARLQTGPLESLDLISYPPANFGISVGQAYGVWIGVLLILYPACHWYSGVKARSSNPIFRYL